MEKLASATFPSELSRLFREARNGSEDAARQIVSRYSGAIRRTVRHLLHQKMRAKFDTCDFEQAVWASIFGEGLGCDDFQSSTELMKYLVRVARNKVVEEFRRRMLSRKYNVNRERSLNDPNAGPLDIVYPQASPSQAAIAQEEWGRLLAQQPDHHQRMLTMRSNGSTFREIAESEQVAERTARRAVRKVRLCWNRKRGGA